MSIEIDGLVLSRCASSSVIPSGLVMVTVEVIMGDKPYEVSRMTVHPDQGHSFTLVTSEEIGEIVRDIDQKDRIKNEEDHIELFGEEGSEKRKQMSVFLQTGVRGDLI